MSLREESQNISEQLKIKNKTKGIILGHFFSNKTWSSRSIYFRDVSLGHKVVLKNNLLSCDCRESPFSRLPCRHEICISTEESKPFSCLNIYSGWKLDYFDASVLCLIEDIGEESKNDVESICEEESEEEQEEVELMAMYLSNYLVRYYVLNPSKRKGKGRPSESGRIKSGFEKSLKKRKERDGETIQRKTKATKTEKIARQTLQGPRLQMNLRSRR